jgi:hypothetical protein
MNDIDRRLIEDYLPMRHISAEGSRERSIRGSPGFRPSDLSPSGQNLGGPSSCHIVEAWCLLSVRPRWRGSPDWR